MGIISKMRKQKAVYWSPSSYDGFGRPVMSTAVQITCRWEDVHEQFLDKEGQEQTSSSRVYVSQDVELGGYLWLGDISGKPSDPLQDNNSWEIRKFENLPNLKATEFLKTAMV
tara:strand:+ start:798 stop:1136 length:339 start_codon:yes stop_codon:yes gene_type:complete